VAAIFASVGWRADRAALDAVAHRGSVGTREGRFASTAGPVYLGQCGADAIACGAEPIRRDELSIVFDGRLYERDALAARLGVCDAQTADDAELVLAAFAAFGSAGFALLDGPFAFVLWDADACELWAVRDRFGLRPLYAATTPAGIAFASEIKQFFALTEPVPRMNLGGVANFLGRGVTDDTAETLFAGVQRVGAGMLVRVTASYAPPAARFETWYELPVPDSVDLELPEAAARFRELLIAAVQRRWDEPGPRGLCLSGGLDSSALAGILAGPLRAGTVPFQAFKARFGDDVYDEPALLAGTLARTGGALHAVDAGASDAFRCAERLVWHLDEPYSRASLAAQWMLDEAVAQAGVRSTLDGQGADEQLAGYATMIAAYAAMENNENADGLRSSRAASDAPAAYGWLAPAIRDAAAGYDEAAKSSPATSLGELCRRRMQVGDLPMMMRHNDRIAMAHGIEPHTPYMDRDLVQFTIALGGRHKIVGGRTKYLLREAMKDLIAPVVLETNFKGSYSALEADWFRTPCGNELRVGALETARAWSELFDVEAVERLAANPAAAAKEPLMQLWRIYTFGIWTRLFRVGA
jgi:asparagine synthase (glutamine-hydrolysing)